MRAELNQGLIDFLKASPTPFHATASLARRLEAAGYRRLDERDAWHTEAGGHYYVTRNDSSLIAIRLGRRSPLESGFRLVGAHTDSPCLRVKPNPEIARNGFLQLGVEVYGGALFAPGSTATCRWPGASPSAPMASWKAAWSTSARPSR